MNRTNQPLRFTLALALAMALTACGGGQTGGGTVPTAASGTGQSGAQTAPTAAGTGQGGAQTAPTTAAGEASEPTPAASENGGGSSADIPGPCLQEAEIAEIVELDARFIREVSQVSADKVVCAYQVSNPEIGAFVSIIVSPVTDSEMVMTELQESARAFLGGEAAAEAIDVGEGGYAYGSDSKSEAAAVAGDRVYWVDITSTAQASVRGKKDAMVEILRRIIE